MRPSAQAHTSSPDAELEELIKSEDDDPGQVESYKKAKQRYTFSGVVLGEGSSGLVIMAQQTGSCKKPRDVALKIVAKRPDKNDNAVTGEVALLRRMKHKNIVKCYGWFESRRNTYVALELARGKNLWDAYVDALAKNKKFTEQFVAGVLYSILSAVKYLHEQNIVHGDLNLLNIMFRTSGDESDVILVDFGHAKRTAKGQYLHAKTGTDHFVSPEAVLAVEDPTRYHYGTQTDMWSVGVIAHFLLSGIYPFRAQRYAIRDLVNGDTEVRFQDVAWRDVSPEAKEFVSKLLDVDQETRMSAADALKHKWIKGGKPSLFRSLTSRSKETRIYAGER
ncbi:kinase-like domain-containing protein [Phellopilus nigrolimitatus]|nr:kinase-like domain-containing protein [Phellopilus nigrolimitatus]